MAQDLMEIDDQELDQSLKQANNNTEANQQINQANNKDNMKSVNAVRDDLISNLQSIQVSELQFAAKAIVLDSKLNPKKAIETLLQYKIRAAPVINGNQFIGVLDLRDTVKYALEAYRIHKDSKLQQIDEEKQDSHNNDNNIEAKQHLLDHSKLNELSLTELCKHRPFRYIKDNDSLLSVAALFADGCHVVGVINSKSNKNELIGIITQGYFFGQIVKKWEFKSNCILKELLDLKYISSPVKMIQKSLKAYDAFQTMIDNDLSGLAVVDESGAIVHNTSATDIKLWLLSSHHLEDTIEQFINSVRNLSLVDRFPVSSCRLKDGFKKAIQMLQATKYHRIWIVDDNRQPIGVLALTDIFQFICKRKE